MQPNDNGSAKAARRRRNRSPTVEQARAFCEVARAGSYAKAALELGYPEHVALIRLVKRFADGLGRSPLVRSDTRGNVTLTVEGADLLPAARRFVDAAAALKATGATIRFSAYPSVAGRVVAECPDLLEAGVPLLLCDISEESRRDRGAQLVRDVERGLLDIVIAPMGLGGGLTQQLALYRWRLRVVLPDDARSASLRKRSALLPQQLKAYNIVAAPSEHMSRQLLEAAFADDLVELEVQVESTNQHVLEQLARNSSRHAAVIADDAFGAPSDELGPLLRSSQTKDWGAGYAIYARIPADSARQTARDQTIAAAVARIVAALRPPSAI